MPIRGPLALATAGSRKKFRYNHQIDVPVELLPELLEAHELASQRTRHTPIGAPETIASQRLDYLIGLYLSAGVPTGALARHLKVSHQAIRKRGITRVPTDEIFAHYRYAIADADNARNLDTCDFFLLSQSAPGVSRFNVYGLGKRGDSHVGSDIHVLTAEEGFHKMLDLHSAAAATSMVPSWVIDDVTMVYVYGIPPWDLVEGSR